MENVVQTSVKIGQQEWTNANLKVVRFRNGDIIPHVESDAQWEKASKEGKPAWCCYDNDPYFGSKFGFLYNWHAVTDPRGLTPLGWHAPTEAEFVILLDFLGGKSVAGGKLKEVGNSHWIDPNVDATNESGFTGLPGGHRTDGGLFFGYDYESHFWSCTEGAPDLAKSIKLSNSSGGVFKADWPKGHGFYVRCIKD